jgi:hypothetical protein
MKFDFLFDAGEELEPKSFEVFNPAVPRIGEKVILMPIEDQGHDIEWEVHDVTHFPLEGRIAFWVKRT